MLKWIIQSNLMKTEVLEDFRKAFESLNIDFEEVKVIPFSEELPIFGASDFNIFYGSTTLMMNAYKSEKFREGVFFKPENFNAKRYLKEWKNELLNDDGVILSFEDFINKKVDEQKS